MLTGPTRRDASEKAYEYIRRRIVSLKYRPRQPLRAQPLAATLGTSRTPVREALTRLTQEGLVRKDRGWGFVVNEMSTRDIHELFSVRLALEVEAAREAVAVIDDKTLGQVVALFNAARDQLGAGRHLESVLTSRRFHLALASCSENHLLLKMLESINDRIQALAAILVERHPQRPAELIEENGRILDALRARDAAGLEAAIRAHVNKARELTIVHMTAMMTL